MRRAAAAAYPNSLRIVTMLAVVVVFVGGVYRAEIGFDPLALPKDFKAETVDLTVQDAARGRDILLRVGDIHVVLDQLARWRADTASPLHGRVDPRRIGMSGHSFGALTTQAVSGQHFPLGDAATDSRIKAAVLFSPSSPRRGDPKKAFDKVSVPWILMTGTEDIIRPDTVARWHREGFRDYCPRNSYRKKTSVTATNTGMRTAPLYSM